VLDKDSDKKISLLDLQDFFTSNCFSMGKGLSREEIEGRIIVSHGYNSGSSREEMEGRIIVASIDNSGSVNFEEFHRILWLITPMK